MVVAMVVPGHEEEISFTLLEEFNGKEIKVISSPDKKALKSAQIISERLYCKFEIEEFLTDDYNNFFIASEFIKKEAELSEFDVVIFITHPKYSYLYTHIEGNDNIVLKGDINTLKAGEITIFDFDLREKRNIN